MRSALLALVLGVLGVSAGVALADGLSLPIPTVPTVTLPTTALPLPTTTVALPTTTVALPTTTAALPHTPTLPTPTLTSSSPSVGVSTPSASQPSSSLAGGSGSSSPSGAAGASGPSSASSSRTSQRSSLSGLHASRSWISTSGPRSRRRTILVFRLARSGPVSFTVLQVSPVCAVADRFVVRGHPGVNRVRFNGKVHGQQLGPGTYRIDARTRGGARVLHVTIVIVSAAMPSAAELQAARRSNVCATLAAFASGTSAGFMPVSRTLHGRGTSSIVRNQNPSGTGPQGHRSSAAPFSSARVSQNATNPLVVAAFGLAVILLGLAALPQRAVPDPRLNDVLVRHRVEVAMAGAGALAAALLALALA